MPVFLNATFKRMSESETFSLADACGAARTALEGGESVLCQQFVALAYTAGSKGVDVAGALDAWHRAYAVARGASVSDKGRISTKDMSEDAKAAYVKVRNSFNVAKSAICKAVSLTDKIYVDDGGSVLLDGNGFPRSKGALLAFVKEVEAASAKTELEKAVSRIVAAYAAARKLSDTDRAIFEDTAKALMDGRMVAGDDEGDDE